MTNPLGVPRVPGPRSWVSFLYHASLNEQMDSDGNELMRRLGILRKYETYYSGNDENSIAPSDNNKHSGISPTY